MAALPHSLFHGLFLSAVALGAVEAIHLAIMADDSLGGLDRLLAALYVVCPFVLLGLTIATMAASLAVVWTRTRRVSPDANRETRPATDLLAAFLITIAFTVALFLVTRSIFSMTADRLVVSGVLAIATPAMVVGALYGWAILRSQLARLENRTGRPTTVIIGVVILLAAVAVPVVVILRDRALADFLGEWTAAFLLAYPMLTIAIATSLHAWSPFQLTTPSVRRWLIASAVVGAAGTIDLVYSLDKSPNVKHALLNSTLVFQPIIVTAQPLFDSDGDGYAGLLGGGGLQRFQ